MPFIADFVAFALLIVDGFTVTYSYSFLCHLVAYGKLFHRQSYTSFYKDIGTIQQGHPLGKHVVSIETYIHLRVLFRYILFIRIIIYSLFILIPLLMVLNRNIAATAHACSFIVDNLLFISTWLTFYFIR